MSKKKARVFNKRRVSLISQSLLIRPRVKSAIMRMKMLKWNQFLIEGKKANSDILKKKLILELVVESMKVIQIRRSKKRIRKSNKARKLKMEIIMQRMA